jgi:hypothetical protein
VRFPTLTICALIVCAQAPDVATPGTSEVDKPFTLRVSGGTSHALAGNSAQVQ